MENKIIAPKHVKKYYKKINTEVEKALAIANDARSKGFDAKDNVEVAITTTMAERVVKLIATQIPKVDNEAIISRILELEKEFSPMDWRVGFNIAKEIALNSIVKFDTDKKSIEAGIRVGFSYLTGGIVAAPLEGLIDIDIRKTKEGKDYLALIYAGPIRGAGGTASSVSVVLADFVRKAVGLEKYDISDEEISRGVTDVYDYNDRVTNLQYLPSEKELRFMLSKLSVQIDGEQTSILEVSNFKDLERIKTNNIRGGVALVLAEGLTQKSLKIWKRLEKWGEEQDLDWSFLKEFLDIQKKQKAKEDIVAKKGADIDVENKDINNNPEKVLPNYTYIKDLVAGRPVFGMPLKKGGFRLRLGKTRISGFSAFGMHPSTLKVLDDFIAYGTQIKIERPGKSASVTLCDTIEPPIVKLKSGEILKLNNYYSFDFEKIIKEIEEIIYLGDILISYGDFSEQGQKLVPLGYCQEWWNLELKNKVERNLVIKENIIEKINEERFEEILKNKFSIISFYEAIIISKEAKIGLHPDYIFYYRAIPLSSFIELIIYIVSSLETDEMSKILESSISKEEDKIEFKLKCGFVNENIKHSLEKIGVEHQISNKNELIFTNETAKGLMFISNKIALNYSKDKLFEMLGDLKKDISSDKNDILMFINNNTNVEIKDKCGTFIGARMGRPEKSKPRNIMGSPNILFPVVDGKNKNILDLKEITQNFVIYYCEKCKKQSLYRSCMECGSNCVDGYYNYKTKEKILDKIEEKNTIINSENGYSRYSEASFNVRGYLKKLEFENKEGIVVKGTSKFDNKFHIVEHLLKGIARAKFNQTVNKDGTMRYDMSECPIVAFKPSEVGLSVEKAIKLGYSVDINGNKLEAADQVLELLPQDIVLPSSENAIEIQADEFLLNSSKVVDDILKNLYGLKSYYRYKSKDSIIGSLVVALAPHISCGTVARVIGFSTNQVILAHPLMHAALRRDCDGDEACVSLLMDVLLNFSRDYLPDRIGARTMDAPLVLSLNINPSEVDDQVHGYDKVINYPLEIYEAAEKCKYPWEVKVLQLRDDLNTEEQFNNFNFTHKTDNINADIIVSAYKTLPTMKDKMLGQMRIAERVAAVDENEVARMVFNKHFMKDIKGNFRKFFKQRFRCSNCGSKPQRPPLMGVCSKCRKGKIIFTVAPGSVVKYLSFANYLAVTYNLPEYEKDVLDKVNRDINAVFDYDLSKVEVINEDTPEDLETFNA